MRTVYEVDDRAGSGRGYDYPAPGHVGRSNSGLIAMMIILFLLVLSLWNEDSWLRNRLQTTPVQVETPILAPGMPVVPSGVPVEPRAVTGVSYVRANSVNMRVGPSNGAPVAFILPQQTPVAIVGEVHQELDGDVWVRVNVNTPEGIQTGWVQRRYLG